jgi:LacI family transcriptional regulator
VAERAGVHPGTASRALDPALPGRVTAHTKEKVERAARELGYTPDPAARSLRTRRSGSVGVVVPDLTNPVIPPIIRGIEEVLWSAGLACLLADTDNDVEREAAAVAELRARRCEGLIIATATRESQTVAALNGADPPAVLVTRDIDDGSLPFVAADDAAGVGQAVSHLVELGHRRIAHVTGPQSLSTTMIRSRAFHDAMREQQGAGVRAPVLHAEAFTIPAGRRAAEDLLRSRDGVTAIVAGNDMIALGCYAALAAARLSCPEDMSIVGHNDMPLVDSVQPPLTTVAIPQRRIGTEAARLLLERLGGDAAPAPRVLLDTELIVRGSTGRPKGSGAQPSAAQAGGEAVDSRTTSSGSS